jgi:hypothetical protein
MAPRASLLSALLALVALLVVAAPSLGAGVSPALRSADHARDRSDRALVSGAHRYQKCGKSSKRCAARHRALQLAGQALARTERELAHTSVVTQRQADLQTSQVAPGVQRARGGLKWANVPQAHAYLVVRRAPGMTSHYSVVGATAIKLPAVPGKTVTYRVRAAVPGSAWSTPTQITYAPKPRDDRRSAPIVGVSGAKISWSKVGDVEDYVVVRKVAGRADVYTSVHGDSVTPTAVPGATATYSVRTAVTDSVWSPDVQITFPADQPSTPAVSPAPTTPSASASSTQATGFVVGLNMRRWDDNDRRAAAILHPRVVRFEMDATNPSTGDHWVDFYASLGATPQPMAWFKGVPSTAQIDALAAWAKGKAGKVKLIELGNEDSYTYKYGDGPEDASYQARARAYAQAAARLGQDLAGSGVGVLAQADDGDTGSSTWVDQMYAAVPDLHKWVAGWVLHPYGPSPTQALGRLVSQVAKHGGDGLKVYCTELGVASDNGRTLSDNYGFAKNMTYQQAADALTSVIGSLKASGKVAQALLYQSTDQDASGTSADREGYFGVLQADGTTTKGALTQAAINLLAA